MAPETATVTADSSPSEVLASLNEKEKATWRQTGDLPERPAKEAPKEKEETPAESSPAAKEVVTESKETPPAESVAAPVVAKEESKPKKNAATRIQELLAETKQLRAENEELRKSARPAPAKEEEVAIPRRNDTDKTGQALYATDEAWLDARDKAVKEIAKQEARQEYAKQQQEEQTAKHNDLVQKRWLNSIKIATEKFPDWSKKVGLNDKDGKYQDAALKSIKERSVLDQFILDSDIGAVLLYHFSGDQAEIDRIQGMSPYAAARELTRLEDKLSAEVSAPEKKETKQATDSSTTQVTRAPAPPASVGGRATAPVDEVNSNLKQGNFKAYRETANREDAQRRKAS